MKTVYCPVINGQIDGSSCFEIVLVADREAKPSILPQSIERGTAAKVLELSIPCRFRQ